MRHFCLAFLVPGKPSAPGESLAQTLLGQIPGICVKVVKIRNLPPQYFLDRVAPFYHCEGSIESWVTWPAPTWRQSQPYQAQHLLLEVARVAVDLPAEVLPERGDEISHYFRQLFGGRHCILGLAWFDWQGRQSPGTHTMRGSKCPQPGQAQIPRPWQCGQCPASGRSARSNPRLAGAPTESPQTALTAARARSTIGFLIPALIPPSVYGTAKWVTSVTSCINSVSEPFFER